MPERADVEAVNSLSLSSVEGKGSSSPRNGCFKCDGPHFQRDCNASKNAGKGKGNRGKSGPRVIPQPQAKEKVRKQWKNPKGSPKGTEGAIHVSKGSGKGESTVGKRVWQSGVLVSPTTTLNRDVAPIGDDIEPVVESRAGVETGYEEEESLQVGIPTFEEIQKNLTSR